MRGDGVARPRIAVCPFLQQVVPSSEPAMTAHSETPAVDTALTSDSPELYRQFIASVVDYAIFGLDAKGNVITWNPGAQRIKGYIPEEIIGRHFSAFYPPEDVAAGKPAHELQVAAREGRFEDEGWRVRKDGSRFWANVVISAIRN